MKRINFACQRNRWPRILVVAILSSLNLTPVRAQDLIPQRQALPCRFCPRPINASARRRFGRKPVASVST